MTKTSTSNQMESSPTMQPIEKDAAEAEQQHKLFYNSIKPQLNELIKNPADETIQKILAYAKKKN